MAIGKSTEVALSRNPENIERQRLTPQYASLILVHSYRHSQGAPPIQRLIFSYLHFIRPEWKISIGDKPKAIDLSKEMIFSFLYGKGNKRKERRVTLHENRPNIYVTINDIRNQLDIMQTEFNNQENLEPENKKKLVEEIAKEITFRDLKFLERKNGRKRNPDSKKPLMDPWLSHLVHFGLNGNSTRVPEFDEMYEDIRAFITRPGAEISQALTDTLKIYGEKHPGIKINLKP